MAKRKINKPDDIDVTALDFIKTIRITEEDKPKDKKDHTTTVVIEGDRGLVVCGSAHRMEGLFVQLIKERPEFRQVLVNAVNAYGNSNNWKL